MHASACSLVFFSQGRDTAALWRQCRTGKKRFIKNDIDFCGRSLPKSV
ncbi:hypothetical protein HMPREF0083_04501 [Aneurinibacillus aneurinilyticus ATCC 12856]|uniref:Uncharacterized protein n=1 Tax=Aneurinibacillus aneurinilyticus ATCC 12856 TaxID=649747 RepID=U1Y9C0_ANEAE|nr:hypothetical protein HMPREF0083_04501 [Aneurinibacillus aneurinilyticus ATCC 12856]